MDDRGRDGRTNFILRIKEQETHLTLPVHDDDNIRILFCQLAQQLQGHTHATLTLF
jgi:hypothetical protein